MTQIVFITRIICISIVPRKERLMSVNSKKKTIKDLNLLDAFLFSETTKNPDNAKLIAQTVIRRVFGWQIADIQVETEKQYHGTKIGRKGIRLDIQVTEKEDGKIIRLYDIEPNTYRDKFIAKRSRYYLSLSDAKLLGTSESYGELPDYFSVWILPYDPFGDNRIMYTVKNIVVENPQIVYNEGVTRIFLYTDGEIGGSEELKNLLKYFKESSECNAVDPELQKIQSIVSDIRNNEEVGERYMTLEELIRYEKHDSYEEGIIKGFISANREFGKSDEEIIQILIDKYSLTREKAAQKVTDN